jgi:hypothetical protein
MQHAGNIICRARTQDAIEAKRKIKRKCCSDADAEASGVKGKKGIAAQVPRYEI